MITDLEKKLKELQAESNIPEETEKKIAQANQELEESEIVGGLNVGEKAPDFTLLDQVGKEVVLSEELQSNPVVLTFYRGKW